MDKKVWILLLFITLIGFIIRIYKVTESPEGLYIDETSIGYNAYSIITTGNDEHGHLMPLFFEAFGEWKLPVYIYVVALVQLFIGPNDLSVRLPAVLFGTFTIPFIFLWIREMLKNKFPKLAVNTAIFASLLLAISPWHYFFTRPGHEASAALFFEVVGLFLFYLAINKKSLFSLLGSGISFVLALYSYNSARIVIPVLMVILFIINIKKIKYWQWILYVAVVMFVSWPFWKFAFSQAGMVRAIQASIIFGKNINLTTILNNFWLNISPYTLFFQGDIVDKAPQMMGLLHLVELPIFIVGVFWLFAHLIIQKGFRKEIIVIFTILIIGIVPAAIANQNPMALRTFLTLPATIFISAIGFSFTLEKMKNKLFKVFFILLILILLVYSEINFLNTYQKYVKDSGERVWQIGKKTALKYISENRNDYSLIILTPELREINAAWYLKFKPNLFWQKIYQDDMGKTYQFVNEIDINQVKKNTLYVSVRDKIRGNLLENIYLGNGEIGYSIWEKSD